MFHQYPAFCQHLLYLVQNFVTVGTYYMVVIIGGDVLKRTGFSGFYPLDKILCLPSGIDFQWRFQMTIYLMVYHNIFHAATKIHNSKQFFLQLLICVVYLEGPGMLL